MPARGTASTDLTVEGIAPNEENSALRPAPLNAFHFAKRFPVEAVIGSLQQEK
jgi:hypothetical protein